MLFVTSLYTRAQQEWSVEEFVRQRDSARGAFTCFEFLTGDAWCKPYFDYETYLQEETDPAPFQKRVVEAITEIFKDSDFSEEQIALAQRHRWVGKQYKISLRAYIQGYKVRFTRIKHSISQTMEDIGFDKNVYNNGRLLGVVGGCKTVEDRVVLTPITHLEQTEAFLAQYLDGTEREVHIVETAVSPHKLHEVAVAAENYLALYKEVKPMIEQRLQNEVTRTYKRQDGFDFDLADRNQPCGLCGRVHNSNMYTCRPLITQCVEIDNYSRNCQKTLLGWKDHPLLRAIYGFPLSDTPYVEMYAAHVMSNGGVLRHDGKRFLFHDGILWKELSDVQLSQNIQVLSSTVIDALLDGLRIECGGQKDEESHKYLKRPAEEYTALLKGSAFVKRWSGMDSVVKAARVTLFDGTLEPLMDRDNDLIGTHSGVIDTRTGELRAGSASDYVSMTVDADWGGLDGPTDVIDSFFESIFNGDKAVVTYVQRLLGYGITGHVKLQLWVVFWGKGSNGKGVLNTMLEKLLGENQYYLSMHRDCLFKNSRRANQGAATPHLAELKNKRIAVCDESAEDDMLDESTIKQVTGGSQINCRMLHQNPITFTPTHLPILMTNHKPKMNIDDAAMTRRLILVPFLNRYVKEADFDASNPNHRPIDYELVDKLSTPEAKRQFLTWLVKGAVEWNRDGLGPQPALLKSAYEEYLQENDAIGRFIKEYCIVAENAFVGTTAFKEALNITSETQMDAKKIKEKMAARGFPYKHQRIEGSMARVYQGLRLKADTCEPLDAQVFA